LAVRRAYGDRHAHLADGEIADAMHHGDAVAAGTCGRLGRYVAQHGLGHLDECVVAHTADGAAVVLLAHGAEKENGGSICGRTHQREDAPGLDGVARDTGMHISLRRLEEAAPARRRRSATRPTA